MNITPIHHGLYLTTSHTDDGLILAICSDGTPQLGHDPVTVLTLEIVHSNQEATEWFAAVKMLKPWETRQ